MMGYNQALVQAMTSPQANQIQQITPEQYGQAQADMQRSKQLQAMAEALASKQYGASEADVVAALVDGFARAKAMKQSDEKWSSAYERAMAYEQQEKERAEAKAKAEQEARWAQEDQRWRQRQDYAANQDAARTKSEREYQAGVTADNRKYAEGQANAAHQRALEMAAAKAQANGANLGDYEKEQLKSDLKVRNELADKALAAERALPLIQSLKARIESGKVDTGPIESRINPLNWESLNSDQEQFGIDSRNLAEMSLKAKFGASVTDSEREAAYRNSPSTNNDEKTNLELLKRYEQELMDVIGQFQALDTSIKQQHGGRSPMPGQAMSPGTEVPAPQMFQSGKYQIEVR